MPARVRNGENPLLLEKETPCSPEAWKQPHCRGWKVILGAAHPEGPALGCSSEGRSQGGSHGSSSMGCCPIVAPETISKATSKLRALARSCSAVPRTSGRMKLLGAVLGALVLLLLPPSTWGGEASRTCIFQSLSEPDHQFCRGELEIIYPEVGDVSCSYIPKCHGYRQKLSTEWGKPRVRYPWAKKSKKYVLVMVDPDSPNRSNPKHRFWRHWLVTDILGSDLRAGKIKGKVLTDYSRPKPARYSGYHRYQFRLYRQPEHQTIALSPEDKESLGTWDLKDFVEDFHLGHPVASTQFLTKSYKD